MRRQANFKLFVVKFVTMSSELFVLRSRFQWQTCSLQEGENRLNQFILLLFLIYFDCGSIICFKLLPLPLFLLQSVAVYEAIFFGVWSVKSSLLCDWACVKHWHSCALFTWSPTEQEENHRKPWYAWPGWLFNEGAVVQRVVCRKTTTSPCWTLGSLISTMKSQSSLFTIFNAKQSVTLLKSLS